MELSRQRTYWPTHDWQERSPQSVNMDPALFAQMRVYIDGYVPGLRSFLVARHGYLIFEHYTYGCTKQDVHYPASAGKSIISALVGIALQRGTLHHVRQTLSEVFPAALLSHLEASKQMITLESLLTMTSGLPREGEYTLAIDEQKNLVSTVLGLPLQEKTFHYNNNGPHILLYLLTLVSQMTIAELAQTLLFQPLVSLQMDNGASWSKDGIPVLFRLVAYCSPHVICSNLAICISMAASGRGNTFFQRHTLLTRRDNKAKVDGLMELPMAISGG